MSVVWGNWSWRSADSHEALTCWQFLFISCLVYLSFPLSDPLFCPLWPRPLTPDPRPPATGVGYLGSFVCLYIRLELQPLVWHQTQTCLLCRVATAHVDMLQPRQSFICVNIKSVFSFLTRRVHPGSLAQHDWTVTITWFHVACFHQTHTRWKLLWRATDGSEQWMFVV